MQQSDVQCSSMRQSEEVETCGEYHWINEAEE